MSQPNRREVLNAVRQMAVLVRLGYPLAEGLQKMSADASPWLSQLSEDLERGDTLEEAMARQPRLFSPYFRSLIEAAAKNPQPDRVLEDLSHWLEGSERIERQVNTLLTYPNLLLSLILAVLALGLYLVAPEVVYPLMNVHQSGNPTVPLFLPWLALLPLLGLLVLLISLLLGQPARPILWMFPEIRGLRSLATQAVWARAFGALLAAGVPLLEALGKSLPIVQDEQLREQMRQAIAETQRGTSLEVALGRCHLEPSLIWSLEGEEPARRVLEGAEALERDIQLRSELQLRLMGPRALVVLGILCTLTLLAFWWPFYTYTAAI